MLPFTWYLYQLSSGQVWLFIIIKASSSVNNNILFSSCICCKHRSLLQCPRHGICRFVQVRPKSFILYCCILLDLLCHSGPYCCCKTPYLAYYNSNSLLITSYLYIKVFGISYPSLCKLLCYQVPCHQSQCKQDCPWYSYRFLDLPIPWPRCC